MNTHIGRPVVVGIDGSERSLDAVQAAAVEATLRRLPLRIVHAFIWPLMHAAVPPGAVKPSPDAMRRQGESFLLEAAEEAGKAAPGLTIATAVVVGSPVSVMLQESRHADLVVLGDRGLGGFSVLIVGSVAVQTVTHAAAPVLIVRGNPRADGPVVVGMDGSHTSAQALSFAAAEADLRGCGLVAMHTWTGPTSDGPGDMLPLVFEPAAVGAEEERLMAEALAGIAARYPDVSIRRAVIRGSARHHLVEWSRQAQLLVVGARGRGGFKGLLLGSVSQHLIYHAACPTAVVRANVQV